MTAMIEVQNLSKHYRGTSAVKDFNLSVETGEIFGLVGPNGCGKTSLVKMMAALTEPDSGTIWIGGHSVVDDKAAVRRLTGYFPERFGVYPGMTVVEYLDYFAACYQIKKKSRRDLIEDLLDLVDLSGLGGNWVETLSAGMQQRLSLARVLIHDPLVLVLDEPFSALDTSGKTEMQNLLVELARMGKTIFMTSHFMAETAAICHRVGVMQAGGLAGAGDLKTVMEQFGLKRLIKITLLGEFETARKQLEKVPVVSQIKAVPGRNASEHLLEMEFVGDDEMLSQVLSYLSKSGVQMTRFSVDDTVLDRILSSSADLGG